MLFDSPELFILIAGLTGLFIMLGIRSAAKHIKAERNAMDRSQEGHVFTFENRELIAASPAAREALNIEDLDEDIYHQMIYRLSDIFPDLEKRTSEGEFARVDFIMREVTTEGPMSIAFRYEGVRTIVRITGIAAPLSRKIILDRDQALAAEAELRTLRGTVEAAPFPMWRENGSGVIDWVNRAYLRLLDQSDNAVESGSWPPPRLFESGKVVKLGEVPVPARKSVRNCDGALDWYDTSGIGIGENSLHFAVDANAAAKAEESQRNFLQTLTQTFAYLATGLAVFDRKRQLIVFNPSLVTLTGLEPQWLISRPTLYDFINHLRENRVVPERKDFTDWRSKVSALERSAKDGTYCETWTLPNGQTYRMTGKPHPEGAIAFLFEDITAGIALTRQFRHQLDLNETVFNALPEALVIFGPDGKILMQNSACTSLGMLDPAKSDTDDALNIIDATRLWQQLAQPTPIWGEVRDFVLNGGERSEWNETITLIDTRNIRCRFAPLAGGLTMVGFEETADSLVLPALRDQKTGETALDEHMIETSQPQKRSAKSA